jgi:16S rRNA (cytidine1402-2'-O)-methyltransferase
VIILVGTPLGNPADASAHLIDVLRSADVIAAEDTRRILRLAKDLDVTLTADIVSYFDANEQVRAAQLIERAQRGEQIIVLSDAGMPTVSDPGYRIVRAAIDAGIPVTCAPGPSAVTTALALSGLPSDRFTFEGFLPRKTGERESRLRELQTEPRTMIFFEAPHRIFKSLTAMSHVFGRDRQVAVCRELTKRYEEVIRGSLAEVLPLAEHGLRGEITIVVQGIDAQQRSVALGLATPESWANRVTELENEGLDRRSAISAVAKQADVPRKEVYAAVIDRKYETGEP